jgi:hypothetical protein
MPAMAAQATDSTPSGSTGSAHHRRHAGAAAAPRRPNLVWTATALAVCSIAGCATMNSQAAALVELQRSGGITGREERLVVFNDGTARLWGRGPVADFTVAGDTLSRLRELLRTIKFDTLRTEYLPPRRGADLFDYLVTVEHHRIHTMDTAVPAPLQPLLQLLGGIIARKR